MSFPAECLEDIFRHLTAKELLECTLACPEWNSFIGSTRSCMKQFELNCLNRESISVSMTTMLRNSNRRYEKLKMDPEYFEEIVELLTTKEREWRFLSFDGYLAFNKMFHFNNFLRIFQSSIQSLKFNWIRVSSGYTLNFSWADLQFPNLKHLSIDGNLSAFVNCSNLETLYISMTCLNVDILSTLAVDAIRTCLKSNKQLKELEFYSPKLFTEDFSSDIGFKLRKLTIGLTSNHAYCSDFFPMKNINLFLKTQIDSLETLVVNGWEYAEVLRTILLMPRLKSLTLRLNLFQIPSRLATETFPQSHSIKYLDIKHFHPQLSTILRAFPEVEILKIMSFDDIYAEKISASCKSLKRLSVEQFSAENISNKAFFAKLEDFSCKEINQASEFFFEKLRLLNGKHQRVDF